MQFEDVKFNRNEILELKQKFLNSNVSSKIVSLIVHGSSLYKVITKEEKDRDIDLELILYNQEQEDLESIKDIISSFPIKVECQLRYLDEIEVIIGNSLIFLSSYKIVHSTSYCNTFIKSF